MLLMNVLTLTVLIFYILYINYLRPGGCGPPVMTKTNLSDIYHFSCEQEFYQMFLLTMDCQPSQIGQMAFDSLQDKATEIFIQGLSPLCGDFVMGFSPQGGYGLMNYSYENKPLIRKKLRDCLRQLEAKKSLYGNLAFTIALDKPITSSLEISNAVERVRGIAAERLMEGAGRLLEPTVAVITEADLIAEDINKLFIICKTLFSCLKTGFCFYILFFYNLSLILLFIF